jgi:RNA-directed DNA polymerase
VCSNTGKSLAGGGRLFKVRNIFIHKYNDIISIENLLLAWQEFLRGKRNKKDVQEFQLHLMKNIFELHQELKLKTYKHGVYKYFKISDPKPRDIHKALVRDRLLHHAIYRILYPYFDQKFIFDSYSCRNNKGTYKALYRFKYFSRIVSKNYTKPCFVLKCDIKKFFASINHQILIGILEKYIKDKNIINLLKIIIKSFNTKGNYNVGLPLGNLTSQLLVNIYMNQFDQFVKRGLKQRYYIRYADDFVFFSESRESLQKMIPKIEKFLSDDLKLKIHPNKINIYPIYSRIDYLGWVHFQYCRVLRTKTKKRMLNNLNRCIKEKREIKEETLQSYLGLLKHGDTYKVRNKIKSF